MFCDAGFTLALDNFNCEGIHKVMSCSWIASAFIDVNECVLNNGECGQMCTNTEGSFQCSCRAGYSLAVNNFSCEGKHGYLHVLKI